MEESTVQVCDRDLSESLLSHYLEADAIAIDTETMGLLPQRDRLCLVQLCDRQNRAAAVRIERGQTSASNLKRLLEASTIMKVFHFARFDVATLRYHLNIQVTPVFCTKIASKLARTYSSRHGLKELVQELEHIELDKSSQSSDWGNAANLSSQQVQYAANDVRYLLGLRDKLTDMLKREQRWEVAQDCFDCIPTFVTLDLMQYQGIFEH